MALAAFDKLVVAGVGFSYGRGGARAVDGVSLTARAGERVAIVGPNGCGKSTLLRLMIGALVPETGVVRVDEKSPREWGRIAMARRVALVPQAGGAGGSGADAIGGGFTVRQTVLMARFAAHAAQEGVIASLVGGTVGGLETEEDLRMADIAMWDCDVHHLADRPVESLSGGERQRVAIARAYVQETPVLLLDEPTSALDLFHQLELLAQLEAITASGDGAAAKGTPRLAVMVTHDLNLAAKFATRVVLMDLGKVVADGTAAEVLRADVLEGVYWVKVVREQMLGFLRLERGS